MRKGFSLVEILISIMVLSIIIVGIMYLFGRSNAAFSISLWKQERTVQAERFWTQFRKYIEEASDLLDIPDDEISNPHPSLKNVASKPLLLHTNPNENEGRHIILAWNVSTLNFDFSDAIPSHSSSSCYYYLYKEGKKITLVSSKGKKVIAQLDDVKSIQFSTKKIAYQADNNRSYAGLGSTGDVVGTLLEISITLSPPDTYVGKGSEIPQNHKFKLNVDSHETPDPIY